MSIMSITCKQLNKIVPSFGKMSTNQIIQWNNKIGSDYKNVFIQKYYL